MDQLVISVSDYGFKEDLCPFILCFFGCVCPVLQPAVVESVGLVFARFGNDTFCCFGSEHVILFVCADDYAIDVEDGLFKVALHVFIMGKVQKMCCFLLF